MTFGIDLVVAKGHKLGQPLGNIDIVDLFEDLFGDVLRWINLVLNFVVNSANYLADVALVGNKVLPAVVFKEFANIVKGWSSIEKFVQELVHPFEPVLAAGSILWERGKIGGA